MHVDMKIAAQGRCQDGLRVTDVKRLFYVSFILMKLHYISQPALC